MFKLRTHQNDTIHSICVRAYGTSAMVEDVLKSNPQIDVTKPVLPQGIIIYLPTMTTQKVTTGINLWD